MPDSFRAVPSSSSCGASGSRGGGRTPTARVEAVTLQRPSRLLIPGTADAAHLGANIAVTEIALDAAPLTTLDRIKCRSRVAIG
ncbi:hypothetical protein [Streptomyces sp. NPDC056670]|uniref:hypothetical protein n=1 Tax=Streptomyces sp. NPDC056670 TaxID=3345904 RepID=UPI0036B80831